MHQVTLALKSAIHRIALVTGLGRAVQADRCQTSGRTESAEPGKFGFPATEGLCRQTSIKLGRGPSWFCKGRQSGNGSSSPQHSDLSAGQASLEGERALF